MKVFGRSRLTDSEPFHIWRFTGRDDATEWLVGLSGRQHDGQLSPPLQSGGWQVVRLYCSAQGFWLLVL